MAKNDNIKDFCKDVADAIRAKKGTTDLINPQDFAAEIASIEGGGSGGEGDWHYFDCKGWENTEARYSLPAFIPLAYYGAFSKSEGSSSVTYSGGVTSPCFFNSFNFDVSPYMERCAIDYSMKIHINFGEEIKAINFLEFVAMTGVTLEEVLSVFGCTEITKEQFYSLE